MKLLKIALILLLVLSFLSCRRRDGNVAVAEEEDTFSVILNQAIINAELPDYIALEILENYTADPAFIIELFSILQKDPLLWILVDKQNPLPADFTPHDLVLLTGVNVSYRINRNDISLRRPAFDALEEMAAAARADGLTLLASSGYRSFERQNVIFNNFARIHGVEEAERFSARPGFSQHQLGLALDFGCITPAFADTPQSDWLKINASRFGWSLSYPYNYEEVTGYMWESWHYRYVGIEIAEFIDTYFRGIQQYALRFLHEWNKLTAN